MNISDTVDDEVSSATQYRYRAALQGSLLFNPLGNLQILIDFFNTAKFSG